MLGKLSQRYRAQEKVLTWCYDDPDVLEQYLKNYQAKRFQQGFGIWASFVLVSVCTFMSYAGHLSREVMPFILPFWFVMVIIGVNQRQAELHRIQSLRLVQHLRSQE